MGGASSALNKVKDFARDVSKIAIKQAGASVPIIGPAIAEQITNSYEIGGAVKNVKTMEIKTPAQLIGLVKKYPDIAEQHGLSVEDIKTVASGKAVGGDISESDIESEEEKPKKKNKPKRKRTAAQIAATKKLVEMNKKRFNKK